MKLASDLCYEVDRNPSLMMHIHTVYIGVNSSLSRNTLWVGIIGAWLSWVLFNSGSSCNIFNLINLGLRWSIMSVHVKNTLRCLLNVLRSKILWWYFCFWRTLEISEISYNFQVKSKGPRIRGTQVKSSVRMKKTQESSKWLFLGNLIPEIDSKAPN